VKHSSAAWLTIILAAVFDITGGLVFAAAEHISNGLGLYFAVATATTAGGDVTPHTAAGHWIAIALMLTAVPLFTAAFSLLTAHLTAAQVKLHVRDAENRLKVHVDNRMRHHPGRSGE
jgi:hypothetical protein